MRIKQIRNGTLVRISFVICTLLFVACDNDNDNSVGNNEIVFASVTALELSVDKADFTGACPHTFKFTGTITTSGAGIVGYRFTDFDVSIKEGVVNFGSAGTQTVTEEFVLTQSGFLDVILEIPRQNFLGSNIVHITATCRLFAKTQHISTTSSIRHKEKDECACIEMDRASAHYRIKKKYVCWRLDRKCIAPGLTPGGLQPYFDSNAEIATKHLVPYKR
jgi:hypothetical protein